MREASITLGFEIGSGSPVRIPVMHTVITGQTQRAGKTTCLEGLITRSGLRAVTFLTKRGEASFAGARRIQPYFREQADWQFVASILEASRGEKLKFERAWIIRASKGARTLADVQRNVRRALESAKGLSADVYLTLEAYLEVVVPQIAAVRWAAGVELAPGVNAMDLTGLALEMQHLVIRSTVDWVLERAHDTVLVVPEAWKFLPQGRGTPVKRAAEAFIRQAAACRNYLWLDSQDIAGVDKIVLKSVPVWILGVQRESNEIKRTLAEIPAGIHKPRPEAVATLGLGQFFACWGAHLVKVYAQPAWMAADLAQAIARGEREIPPAARLPAAPAGGPRVIHEIEHHKEEAVTEAEAKALREENQQLKARIRELERRIMMTDRPAPAPPQRGSVSAAASPDTEALYQAIKARLLEELPKDPLVLRVLVERPELLVQVERRTVEASGATLNGMLARLISEGFFDDARTGSAANTELQRRGFPTAKPNVYREADKLATLGFLTKEADGYRAVAGMKVNVVER